MIMDTYFPPHAVPTFTYSTLHVYFVYLYYNTTTASYLSRNLDLLPCGINETK